MIRRETIMENTLIFTSEKEVRFGKLLKFIIPTYLTSLFNTVYTIIDGIFVSAYVGTDALASINIVYPIVNVLPGTHLYLQPEAVPLQLCILVVTEKQKQTVPFLSVRLQPSCLGALFPCWFLQTCLQSCPCSVRLT